jgi:hypothetical protein
MRVGEDGQEDNRVADEDREQRLPPVHARADEPGRQHVRRDAVRHGDPERRVRVRAPRTLRDLRRREVLVEERRIIEDDVLGELHASVWPFDLLVCHGPVGRGYYTVQPEQARRRSAR